MAERGCIVSTGSNEEDARKAYRNTPKIRERFDGILESYALYESPELTETDIVCDFLRALDKQDTVLLGIISMIL